MRNRFFTNSTDDIILAIDHMYNIHDCIIPISVEDIHKLLSGAENVIMLHGKGSGNNRISNAIENAVLHACDVANGYNLFTAEKIIIKISYSNNSPIMIAELSEVSNLVNMFKSDTGFIWGISETQGSSSSVDMQIVASNLHKQ